MASSSSLLKGAPSRAFILSFSCSGLLAPTSTDVTWGFLRIHHSAICARDCPRFRAIQSVKVKTFGEDGLEREIKMADKLKALELLGKHMGMFKDKVELSGRLETEKTKLDDLIQQMRGGG